MLKKISLPLVIVSSVVITGCSQILPNNTSSGQVNTSQFEPLDEYKDYHPKNVGDNEKRLSVIERASGHDSIVKSKKIVMQRANAICKKSNKNMIPIKEHIANPPYMINHYPGVYLTFVCQSSEEAKLATKKKEVVKKVEVSKDFDSEYDDLVKLKKLLDEKILTQQEFDAEKKKILNR